jgi:hypothetical protein
MLALISTPMAIVLAPCSAHTRSQRHRLRGWVTSTRRATRGSTDRGRQGRPHGLQRAIEREARSISALNHPHILRPRRRQQDGAALVMEFADGTRIAGPLLTTDVLSFGRADLRRPRGGRSPSSTAIRSPRTFWRPSPVSSRSISLGCCGRMPGVSRNRPRSWRHRRHTIAGTPCIRAGADRRRPTRAPISLRWVRDELITGRRL